MIRLTQFALFAVAGFAISPAFAQFGTSEDPLGDIKKRLKNLEKKVDTIGQWMLELKKSPLTDTENSQLKVFQLKYAESDDVLAAIGRLIGEQGYRIAIDPKRNSLIVSSSESVIGRIEDVIQAIDRVPSQKKEEAEQVAESSSKPLSIRSFWINDGTQAIEGRNPVEYLPNKVIDALHRMGLDDPLIVSQSTSALISKTGTSSNFRSTLQAAINGVPIRVETSGKLSRKQKEQIQIEIEATLWRRAMINHQLERFNEWELSGSLTAPLGHYMVLGSANYVNGISFQDQVAPKLTRQLDEAKSPTKLTTCRFALVIQVVEGGSYAPEK